jgi:linoleate 10R-lipoxygenase
MAQLAQDKVVQRLYNDLVHPSATSIGQSYAWRTADGSCNNIDMPDMGKAGTPYGRSVQQSHPLPRDHLPDPGLIFDTLLKRDGFVKHPAGLSSMMFNFAALVIHSVFRTSHTDVSINDTSSYIDLAPLYGHNQEYQDRVRIRDGTGRLYPDVFAENRLLFLPPGVCALLILFNRNHNYIVKRLLDINERGTFVDPASLQTENSADKAKLIAQDEELFQTGRLINCGWFASIVFSDYFSCILGLVRDGSSWSLNPFGEMRHEDHTVVERGKGNVVSVEFNCLYRWHATTSEADEKWNVQLVTKTFNGKSPLEVTIADFKAVTPKIAASIPDVQKWTIGKIQRQEDGGFKDEDLANILHDATEHPAGAFRARGTPESMRLHEILGIEQNRQWGVCSLNEFRAYLGLKRYKNFQEWNPDPEVADAAEKLYGHIDNLELYVGLQAEEAKPVMDGAGLCPGYTISRAILSDAIALTRGDRYFTHDYTPYNLTAWGFADCQRDPNAFGFGSTLGRLLLRTLPNQYTKNSVYTFFPLMTPDAMKKILTKLKVIDQYDLSRPTTRTPARDLTGYTPISEVLKNKDVFVQPYATRAAKVIPGKGFYIAEGSDAQEKVQKALADSTSKIGTFFYDKTRELVELSSYSLVGKKLKAVDVVRDVLKVVPVLWVASEVVGIPLKTEAHPQGHYTVSELYNILGDIYSYIFLHVDPARAKILGAKVSSDVKTLLGHIKEYLAVDAIKKQSVVRAVGSVFSKANKKPDQSEIVKRLASLGGTTDELANTVLALMVSSTVELSLALTNATHLLVDPEHHETISTVVGGTEAQSPLDGYVYESLRIDPPFEGVYRTVAKDHTIGDLAIKDGDRVFLNIAGANLDETVFSDPLQVNVSRGNKDTLRGDGLFDHLGEPLTVKIIGDVLRAVYSFKGIRRGPGTSGTLPRFKDVNRPDLRFAYRGADQFSAPWPTSFTLLYDVVSEKHSEG